MANIKFTAEMAELRKKINFVRNGLGSSKTDLPVMLIRGNVTGQKLTLFAANKELFCRTEVKIQRNGEDQADGSFSVLGGKLTNLINTAEAERAALTVDPENLEAKIGFLTVNLQLYDGAALKQVEHQLSEHLTQEGGAIDRGHLEEALSCAKSCTTQTSIRPDVTHIELRGGRVLSSDGRKIMIYSHDGFNDQLKLKVPSATLNPVLTAIKNVDAEGLQIIEGNAYFFLKGKLNEFTMGIRKVERDFPAVEGQISAAPTPDDEIAIDKNVLQGMIQGVSLGLDNDEVKVTVDADGAGKEAYLEVSARNSLGRRSFERASASRNGARPTTLPVSYRHLADTLSVFKGDSVVDILVMQSLNMLMIKDSTETREVTTLIPFRTESQIEQEKREAAEAEAKKPTNQADSDETAQGAAIAAAETEDVDLA